MDGLLNRGIVMGRMDDIQVEIMRLQTFESVVYLSDDGFCWLRGIDYWDDEIHQAEVRALNMIQVRH
ncbi:hypothetical protein, partial [Paenibacillus xylanexedens]|uniref:hypothetical protein n=1 Tax=Paenibacillus xylanexedens TaxID=528191 RepID=UPI001C92C109